MEIKPNSSRTVCKDGVSLSVQSSRMHYCEPRNDEGPYSLVEVGYVKGADGVQFCPPDSWKDYADLGFPSDVYGFVPVELVKAFIAKHGGEEIASAPSLFEMPVLI